MIFLFICFFNCFKRKEEEKVEEEVVVLLKEEEILIEICDLLKVEVVKECL